MPWIECILSEMNSYDGEIQRGRAYFCWLKSLVCVSIFVVFIFLLLLLLSWNCFEASVWASRNEDVLRFGLLLAFFVRENDYIQEVNLIWNGNMAADCCCCCCCSHSSVECIDATLQNDDDNNHSDGKEVPPLFGCRDGNGKRKAKWNTEKANTLCIHTKHSKMKSKRIFILFWLRAHNENM